MSSIPIYNELSKFLYNSGLCSLQKSQQIFTGMTDFHEDLAIFSIQNFLNHLKFSENQVRETAKNLFEKYIQNDDGHIRKIMRKLFVAYAHFRRDLMYKFLMRWRNRSMEMTGKVRKSNRRNNKKMTDNDCNNTKCNNINNLDSNFTGKETYYNHNSFNYRNTKEYNDNNYNINPNNNLDYRFNNENDEIINVIYQSVDNAKFNCPNNSHSQKIVNIKATNNSKQVKNNNKMSKNSSKNKGKTSAVSEKNIPNSSLNSILLPSKSFKSSALSTIPNNNFNNFNVGFLQNNVRNNDADKKENVTSNKKIGEIKPDKPKRWNYSYIREPVKDDYYLNSTISYENNKKKRNLSKQERIEFFNNLYQDSQNRKDKLMKMNLQKEAKFNETYTFEPKIVSNRMNKKYLKNFTEINNNLATKTGITSYAESSQSSQRQNKCPDFLQRLKTYEKNKEEKMRKIQEEIKSSNPQAKNVNKKLNPLESHLLLLSKNFNEEKQKKLDKITEAYLMEQGITFEPETNKLYNDKIKSNFLERNEGFIKEREEKLSNKSSATEKECTFTPEINRNIQVKSSADVINRLYDYKRKHDEKINEIKNKYAEFYSFKPEISKNTDGILTNKKRLMEELKEKYDFNALKLGIGERNNNENATVKKDDNEEKEDLNEFNLNKEKDGNLLLKDNNDIRNKENLEQNIDLNNIGNDQIKLTDTFNQLSNGVGQSESFSEKQDTIGELRSLNNQNNEEIGQLQLQNLEKMRRAEMLGNKFEEGGSNNCGSKVMRERGREPLMDLGYYQSLLGQA